MAPPIVGVGIVEAAVHEEGVCLDPGERGALLRGVCQGAQGEVAGGDVVADAQHHTAFDVLGDLPEVVLGMSIPHVPVVVVTAGDASDALRRGLVESRLHNPPRI